MKILLLGGTLFLGRHLAEEAVARGHRVTLFHRGRTRPHLFPAIEKLHGDRQRDLSALAGRSWDAVIDTSGYLPAAVRRAAQTLHQHVAHYTFLSTISVYDFSQARIDESSQLKQPADPSADEVRPETYGALKAACERALAEAWAGAALTLRPGLLVGPYDPTDRFTSWIRRIHQGGEVLAPGNPRDLVQLLDARDLAAWIIALVEKKQTGIYNAVGAHRDLTLGRLLTTIDRICGQNCRFTWVDDAFLLDHEVTPWSELPLWLPEPYRSFYAVDPGKARDAGLEARPLANTVEDTLHWDLAADDEDLERYPHAPARPPGLARQREAELLQGWHARADSDATGHRGWHRR